MASSLLTGLMCLEEAGQIIAFSVDQSVPWQTPGHGAQIVTLLCLIFLKLY